MIKCIIVDDEPLATAQLEAYVSRIPFLECVASFHSALEAQGFLSANEVDVMFVDINMPDVSGMQLVRSLKNPPKVVFTTAYSEYAVEGFKVDAVDYLMKPIGFEDFMRTANKVNELCVMERDARLSNTIGDDCGALFVKSDYRVIRISVNDIKFIESMSEYVRIFVDGETRPVVTLLSMRKVEEALPASVFMRVHRSYIVNLNKVKEVSRMRILYDGNVSVPIGDIYKDKFFAYINNHILGK